MSGLDRFLKAQDDDYQKALKEIKNGKKVLLDVVHFSQINRLGTGSNVKLLWYKKYQRSYRLFKK